MRAYDLSASAVDDEAVPKTKRAEGPDEAQACRVLHAACGTLHAARRMERCMLQVACRTLQEFDANI